MSSPCCRSTQKKKDKAEQMLVPRNKTAGLTFQTVSSLFQETLLSQRGDFKFKTSHPWVSFWPTLSFWSVFGEGRHSPPAKDYHFKGLCQNHIRSMIKFWKLTFKGTPTSYQDCNSKKWQDCIAIVGFLLVHSLFTISCFKHFPPLHWIGMLMIPGVCVKTSHIWPDNRGFLLVIRRRKWKCEGNANQVNVWGEWQSSRS